MSLTLAPELQKLIEDEVRSGRSLDPNDFSNKAVNHYVLARDLGEAFSGEEIEDKISRGLADLDRGEGIDREQFFEQLRLHGEQLRR